MKADSYKGLGRSLSVADTAPRRRVSWMRARKPAGHLPEQTQEQEGQLLVAMADSSSVISLPQETPQIL